MTDALRALIGRQVALAAAGPALIVALVITILHDVVFNGVVSDRNPDLLAFWMPNQCFLAQELTAGRIPYWNPHAFGGVPFAADPQSGWMYLPMMALSLVSCDIGIRALVVFFPLLGGLGGYAFLRGEGASRAAATIAGLCIAGVTAGSALAVTLTFVGFMAWSPWILAAVSRALRSETRAGRLGWITATALLWGQLAAAHISNGLVMGSALVAFFCVYKATVEVRAGRLRARTALLLGATAGLMLILANLAYLLPRVLYLERSTIGLGYEALSALRDQLWGEPAPTVAVSERVTEPVWILRLATSPGAYLGALPLVLSPVAAFSRRLRTLALTLWVYVVVFYAAAARPVAEAVQRLFGDGFLGDFYSHAPARFAYAPILALCLLAGLGAETWREERSWQRRVAMILPGLLLWGIAPLAAGAVPARMLLFFAAVIVAIPLLLLASRRPALWALLAIVLAAELTFNGIYGQSRSWEPDEHGLTDPTIVGVEPMPEPDVNTADFASQLSLLEPVGGAPEERWITLDPPLHLLGRQMISGLDEAQGYNPVQLRRYWIYTRAFGRGAVHRSPRLSLFKRVPDEVALDLLHVRYVATTAAAPPGDRFDEVAAVDGWTVWELPEPSPPASHFPSYDSIASSDEALEVVTGADFDPSRDVVIERDGLSAEVSHAAVQPVELRWADPARVEATVDVDQHGFLLLRIPYDEHWSAEVDGRRREVLPANYLLQAVEVAAGKHVVRMTYRDPWVTRGLGGSAVVLATVAAVCVWMRRRRRENEAE